MFVDSEYNFKEVERFFEVHIQCFFEDMSIYDTFANNHPTVSLNPRSYQNPPVPPPSPPILTSLIPKTFLHHRLTNYFGCSNYRIMADEIPSYAPSSSAASIIGSAPVIAAVMIHNEIVADASASSGKNAKVKASDKANRLLENMIPVVFRKRFGCDCEGKRDGAMDLDIAVGTDVGSAI